VNVIQDSHVVAPYNCSQIKIKNHKHICVGVELKDFNVFTPLSGEKDADFSNSIKIPRTILCG
jgi:hypothetical protein